MPLPQLQTGIDLTPGFNALMQAKQLKGQQQETGLRNALLQRQLDQADAEATDPIAKLKRVGEAYKAAFDTGQPELAKRLIKEATGDDVTLDFMGEEITIETPSMSYKGPKSAVQEYNDALIESPEWFTKPENVQQALKAMASKTGVKEFKIKDPKKPEAWKPMSRADQLAYDEDKARIGAKYKDKSGTTTYLFNVQNGQTEQYSKDEADRLKTENPHGYLDGKERREMLLKAVDKVPAIKKAIAEFGQDGKITQLIIAANPELASMMGQSVDDQTKNEVVNSMKRQLKYYEKFLPEDQKPKGDPLGLGL